MPGRKNWSQRPGLRKQLRQGGKYPGKDARREGPLKGGNRLLDILPWISWYLVLTPEPLLDLAEALRFAVPKCPRAPRQREASSSQSILPGSTWIFQADLAAKAWEGKRL